MATVKQVVGGIVKIAVFSSGVYFGITHIDGLKNIETYITEKIASKQYFDKNEQQNNDPIRYNATMITKFIQEANNVHYK